MRDLVVYAWLVVAFAVLVTAHVALVVGLARRARPRAKAIVALVVPVLAPIWGVQARMIARSVVWCVGAAAYVAAWIVAR